MPSESAKLNTSSNFVRITNSDVTSTVGVRALYVVTGGTLSLVNSQGVTVDFGTVAVGQRIDVQPAIVRATGTTAVVNGLY